MSPSMKRAIKTLAAIADLRLKPEEHHAAVTQAFDNLRPKTRAERDAIKEAKANVEA